VRYWNPKYNTGNYKLKRRNKHSFFFLIKVTEYFCHQTIQSICSTLVSNIWQSHQVSEHKGEPKLNE
jgi:hypothetical protein